MHALNNAFGGTTFEDLCRQLPEALQHKHPPERGLRRLCIASLFRFRLFLAVQL